MGRPYGDGGLCSFEGGCVVSTEIHVGGLSSSIPGAIELTGEFDRVLHTAADRPHTDTLPALRDPAADHGDRRAETPAATTSRKSTSGSGSSSMRPGTTPSCSGWPTRWPGLLRAAIWGSTLGSEQSAILLFINRTSRAVIADNVQS